MRRRNATLRPLLCAGLLSLTLLLTGCAEDEPKPKFEEPAASPTPSPVEETAEEFIKRWALLEKEMQNTGETEEYRAITPGCKACVTLADRVDAIYGAGGYIKAGGRTVVSTQPSGANEHHVIVTIKPTTYVETTGGPEQSMAGGTSEYLVTLKERESGYVLTDYVRIAS